MPAALAPQPQETGATAQAGLPDGWRQAHVGHWLSQALQKFDARVLTLMARNEDVPLALSNLAARGRLSASHIHITRHLAQGGARLTELLKQPQFSPLKMEEQVVVIYAGVNGYLDALPVAKVKAFEEGLLSLLRGKNVDILNAIRDSRDLSDDTAAKLKSAVEGYAKSFA